MEEKSRVNPVYVAQVGNELPRKFGRMRDGLRFLSTPFPLLIILGLIVPIYSTSFYAECPYLFLSFYL
jgi:hypothetical protein